jgi:hypothetical protein
MTNQENPVIKEVQILTTPKGWRLFRNALGVGWVGKLIDYVKGIARILNAHRISFGLTDGASDLIGWRPVKITKEMDGKTIAQFCAVEVKTKAYPTLTKDQKNFLKQVKDAGGYAAVYKEGKGFIDEK